MYHFAGKIIKDDGNKGIFKLSHILKSQFSFIEPTQKLY